MSLTMKDDLVAGGFTFPETYLGRRKLLFDSVEKRIMIIDQL